MQQPLLETEETNWFACVALAGGHPSLLLDCFGTLTRTSTPVFHPATVGAAAVKLETNHRVALPLSDKVTAQRARDFVQDMLTSRVLDEGSHTEILDAGLAWFIPHPNRKGKVSAPFPYLLRLMKKAGGMYTILSSRRGGNGLHAIESDGVCGDFGCLAQNGGSR
jgi:hypothetical protein